MTPVTTEWNPFLETPRAVVPWIFEKKTRYKVVATNYSDQGKFVTSLRFREYTIERVKYLCETPYAR